MRVADAEREFEQCLRARHVDVRALKPAVGIEAMLAFYRDVRAEDADPPQTGDMLLFQWGTYDWGAGEQFELDIARQLARSPGEDEDIWQLSLTFRLPPDDTLRALGSGNRWCQSPADLPAFAEYALATPAYRAVSERSDAMPSLRYACAG